MVGQHIPLQHTHSIDDRQLLSPQLPALVFSPSPDLQQSPLGNMAYINSVPIEHLKKGEVNLGVRSGARAQTE